MIGCFSRDISNEKILSDNRLAIYCTACTLLWLRAQKACRKIYCDVVMACGGANRSSNRGQEWEGDDEEEEYEEPEPFTTFEGKPEELGKFLDEHKPSDPAWNT